MAKQAVGEPIPDVLESVSGIVNEHIRNTQQNGTEYCKREECWDKLKAMDFVLPGSIRDEYISETSCGKYDPTILNKNKVVEFCKNKGSKGWLELYKWLRAGRFLTPNERFQSFDMVNFLQKGKEPPVALSILCASVPLCDYFSKSWAALKFATKPYTKRNTRLQKKYSC